MKRTKPCKDDRAPSLRSLKEDVQRFVDAPGARAYFEEHLVIEPENHRWPVLVDTTIGCNQHCPFCWNTEGRKRELAQEPVLEKLVSDVLPYAEDIAFGCRHEATLHPALPRVAAELDRERRRLGSDARLVLLTSGSLMDEAMQDALARCGLDYVLFSVDTTDPEIFARLRPPSNWPQLRRRIAAFVEACLGRDVQVGANALILRSTLRGLPATLEELGTLGLSSLSVSQAVALSPRISDDLLRREGPLQDEVDAIITGLRERAAAMGMELFAPEPAPPVVEGDLFPIMGQGRIWDESELREKRPSVCAAPWSRVRIDHEGNVFPCQFMLSPAFAWGNILEASFEEIVNGEAAVATRKTLLRGEAPNDACRNCFYGPICG